LDSVEVGKFEFPLLRLKIEIRQHCDLYRTGLGEYFVFMEEEMISAREVFDGDSHHTIEMLIDFMDLRFQFLPENLLLPGGGSCTLRNARADQKDDTD
jgi:hypothetical protein